MAETVYFASYEDVHDFDFGYRMFNNPGRKDLPRYETCVWVLCGLPGTGKSTFGRFIAGSYPPFQCKIISRDEARTDLLWDIRKEERFQQQLAQLDTLTSRLVKKRLRAALKHQGPLQGVVVDGCHTDYATLLDLLQYLHNYGKRIRINLVIMGTSESPCAHLLNDHDIGDYSDYSDGHGSHIALPKKVFEMKRTQFIDLTKIEHIQTLSDYCDTIYCIPACGDRIH